MKRFKPFYSPTENFAQITRKIFGRFDPLSYLLRLYYRYNLFDTKRVAIIKDKVSPATSNNFLGGFNPLIDNFNDIKRTLNLYKSWFDVGRELLQPVRGITNILSGAINLALLPVVFLFRLISLPFLMIAAPFKRIYDTSFQDFWKYSGTLFINLFKASWSNLARNFIDTAGGLVYGLSSILHGVNQLVTTPITYLLMPFKAIITGCKYRGFKTFVDANVDRANEITELVNDNSVKIETISERLSVFSHKIEKANSRGQKAGSNTTYEELKTAYDNCKSRESALQFLSIFTNKETVKNLDIDHVSSNGVKFGTSSD